MSLRDLAAKATPGPWTFVPSRSVREPAIVRASDGKTVVPYARTEECARLIALAPELAVLCSDMADALQHLHDVHAGSYGEYDGDHLAVIAEPLLARFRELEARP